MRVLVFIFTGFFFLSACSSPSPEDAFTLQDAINVFEEEGHRVARNEQAPFHEINARDGVVFYINNDPVRIYEFSNERNFNRGARLVRDLGTFSQPLDNWPRIGLVVLETHNSDAIALFNRTLCQLRCIID